MVEPQTKNRYCTVTCLGCNNPIPLFMETVGEPGSTPANASETEERPFFRAWCRTCGREYPYLSSSLIWSNEPPVDKQHRQLEFPRLRGQFQVKRAHA
jgi:hypothetical protein